MRTMLMLLFVSLAATAAYYYLQFRPRRCSGKQYWWLLLNTSAFVVSESKGFYTVAVPRRHSTEYVIVSKSAAQNSFSSSIVEHCYKIIHTRPREELELRFNDHFVGDCAEFS